jgi:hypothetical protein
MWRAATAVILLVAMSNDMTGPTITITPMPPTEGQTMRVEHSGGAGITITFDWSPSGSPASAVTNSQGYVDVIVPRGASSVIVSGGGAPKVGTVISPP